MLTERALMRRFWTSAEGEYLKAHYANNSTLKIVEHLGRPIRGIYVKAGQLELAKSEEYIRDPANGCGFFRGHHFGRATQFSNGHVPANKGLRRPGWFAGRMRETQFRKGERSGKAAENWKPIGTILPDSEGYLRIKVREAVHGREATGFGNTKVWPMYNRYVWEQHHGPIPPKHVVIFKDRKRENCAIENLELISMADNARRNSTWSNYPRELAEAIQLQSVLKRKLRKLDGKE
jgi:hypothetical protein